MLPARSPSPREADTTVTSLVRDGPGSTRTTRTTKDPSSERRTAPGCRRSVNAVRRRISPVPLRSRTSRVGRIVDLDHPRIARTPHEPRRSLTLKVGPARQIVRNPPEHRVRGRTGEDAGDDLRPRVGEIDDIPGPFERDRS